MFDSADKSVRTSKENGKISVKGNLVQQSMKHFLQKKNKGFRKHSDTPQWPVRKSDFKGSCPKCPFRGSFAEYGKVLKFDKSYKSANVKIQNNNSNSIEKCYKDMDQLCTNLNILSCCHLYLLTDKNNVDKKSRDKSFNSEFVFGDKSRQHNSPEGGDAISKKAFCKLEFPIGDESWNKVSII